MTTYKQLLNSLSLPAKFSTFSGWWKDFYALEWQGTSGFENLRQDAIQSIVAASILTHIRRGGVDSYGKIVSGDASFTDPKYDGLFHPKGKHGLALEEWDFCPKVWSPYSPYTQSSYCPTGSKITKLVGDSGEISHAFDPNGTAVFLSYLAKPYLVFGDDGKTVERSNIEVVLDDRLANLVLQVRPFLHWVIKKDYNRPGDPFYYHHDGHAHVEFHEVADFQAGI